MTYTHKHAAPPMQAGFTIIELMVGITVLGILLGIGVPAFSGLIRDQRLSTQTNEVVGALTYARGEAATRGQPVSICAATDANFTACDDDAESWTNGWIVFTDRGATPGEIEIDAGEEIIQTGHAPAMGFSVTPVDNTGVPAAFVRFGTGNAATTARVFTVRPVDNSACAATQTRLINVSLTGRISTAKGACS